MDSHIALRNRAVLVISHTISIQQNNTTQSQQVFASFILRDGWAANFRDPRGPGADYELLCDRGLAALRYSTKPCVLPQQWRPRLEWRLETTGAETILLRDP